VLPPCKTIATDPRHLGAPVGFFSVLHSWGQNLILAEYHDRSLMQATSGCLRPVRSEESFAIVTVPPV